MTQGAVVVAFVGLIVGCSGGDSVADPSGSDDAASPSATEVVESTSSTSAEVVTTTTAVTTTESSAPSVTFSEVEAEVRAAHTRFMTELFTRDERVDGPEAAIPLIDELTIDPQSTRMKESIADRLDNGERLVSSGPESNVVDVIIDGGVASVLDCALDPTERFSSDGDLLGSGDGLFGLVEVRLVQIGGNWLVEDFITGGSQECDPGDYS